MTTGVGGEKDSVASIVVDQGLLERLEDIVRARQGTTLMREGDAGTEMYIVREGQIEVTYQEQLLDFLGPGEMVGEMSLLTGQRRSATVVCASDCVLYRIKRDAFQRLATEDTVLFSYCMQVMAARLSRMNEIASTLMQGPAGAWKPQVQRPLARPRPRAKPAPEKAAAPPMETPVAPTEPVTPTPAKRPAARPRPQPKPTPRQQPAAEDRWDKDGKNGNRNSERRWD